MTDLNNVPGYGVGGINPQLPEKENDKEKEIDSKEPAVKSQTKKTETVSPDSVLDYMAQLASINNPNILGTKYDVSKYVTPEQAQRIIDFVMSFEGQVTENLTAIDQEFGNLLSDADKMNLALAIANKNN